MSESIKIAEAPEHVKFTRGEQLYEFYSAYLWEYRYLRGALGTEANPFVRWKSLPEDEKYSWMKLGEAI